MFNLSTGGRNRTNANSQINLRFMVKVIICIYLIFELPCIHIMDSDFKMQGGFQQAKNRIGSGNEGSVYRMPDGTATKLVGNSLYGNPESNQALINKIKQLKDKGVHIPEIHSIKQLKSKTRLPAFLINTDLIPNEKHLADSVRDVTLEKADLQMQFLESLSDDMWKTCAKDLCEICRAGLEIDLNPFTNNLILYNNGKDYNVYIVDCYRFLGLNSHVENFGIYDIDEILPKFKYYLDSRISSWKFIGEPRKKLFLDKVNNLILIEVSKCV